MSIELLIEKTLTSYMALAMQEMAVPTYKKASS